MWMSHAYIAKSLFATNTRISFGMACTTHRVIFVYLNFAILKNILCGM